jgi:hypothetical protein
VDVMDGKKVLFRLDYSPNMTYLKKVAIEFADHLKEKGYNAYGVQKV